jgi:hypothetical protein
MIAAGTDPTRGSDPLPVYRLVVHTVERRLDPRARLVHCAHDDEAMLALFGFHAIYPDTRAELWQGDTLIYREEPVQRTGGEG